MNRAERRALDRIARDIGFTDIAITNWLNPPRWPTPAEVRYAREKLDKRIGPADGDKAARQHAYASMRRLKTATDARNQHWHQHRDDPTVDPITSWVLALDEDKALEEAIQAQASAGLFILPPGITQPLHIIQDRIQTLETRINAYRAYHDLADRIIERINRDRRSSKRRLNDRVLDDIGYDDHGLAEIDGDDDYNDDDSDDDFAFLTSIAPGRVRKVITDWIEGLTEDQIIEVSRKYPKYQPPAA